jgi:hypothetical protein
MRVGLLSCHFSDVGECVGLFWGGLSVPRKQGIYMFVESICQRIQAQTARGYPVLIVRQDNAGEIKKLEKRLQSVDWKLLVKMDYTAANSPQQNALEIRLD